MAAEMSRVKNVTITLDESTVQWARQAAAERGCSVSRYVGDLLRQHMQHEGRYELAMKQYFALEPRPLRGPGEKYPSREELYDRPRLR
jgi:hypothetical protein